MRVARTLLGLLALPHEVVHFLLFAPWRDDLHIVLAPDDDSPQVSLARIGGTVSTDIPRKAVQLAAIGPMIVFPLVAVFVRLAYPQLSAVPLLGVALLLSFWGVPSDGDINIVLRPDIITTSGSFETTGTLHPKAPVISITATVALTWLVAGILLL